MANKFSDSLLGYVNEHIAKLDALLEKDPENLTPLHNKGLLLLSVDRFAEGWPLLEHRLHVPECRFSYDHLPIDRWDGESIAGKDVLVWLDQGIGDQIMGASMLGELAAVAAHVSVICARRLVPIMRRSFPTIHFHKVGERVSQRLQEWNFDCQISMHELGMMFRSSPDKFTGKPYLKAAELDVDYECDYSMKTVGVSWESQSKVCGNEKTIPIQDFMAVLSVPGVRYINLQYDPHPQDLRYIKEGVQGGCVQLINNPAINQIYNMDSFASQVAECDAVVTSSNSLAHLAGALGVKTYVIVPKGRGCHWYWNAEGDSSLWYESVTILRQASPGDWSQPIMQANNILNLQYKQRKTA